MSDVLVAFGAGRRASRALEDDAPGRIVARSAAAAAGWECVVRLDSRPRALPSLQWTGPAGGVWLWGLGLARRRVAAEELFARFEREGVGRLAELPGRIAGAIWRREPGELTVFRDKLGLTPLFVDRGTEGLAVGSHPEHLVGEQPGPEAVDRRRLAAFVLGSDDGARNFFFEGVERLRPREYLTRRAGDASGEVGRYWSVDVDPLPEDVDPARRLRRRLEEVLEQETAPRVHAVSGGIDSSALAAVDSRVQSRDGHRLMGATVDSERYEGVTDPEILRALDRRLEIDRRTFCLDGRLPLTDPAIYRRQLAWGPHHHVDEQWLAPFFEETRRRTGRQTIAVGLGGDRIWRGRPGLSVHDALAGRRWRALGRFGRRLPSRQFVKLLAGRGVALSGSRRLVELKQAVAGGGERPVWRRPGLWVIAVDGWHGVRRSLGDLAGRGPARRALVADRDGWPWELVGLALHRHRCRSGVRLACPLLDPSIWTLGLRIPPDRHYGDGEQKAVLRESVRDLLPEEVVDAPKHGLFDEVVEDALGRRRRHLVVELFDDPLLAETGLLEPDRFREVFDRYCRAIARRSEPLYGSLPIWRTIAAELWLRALRC